MLILHNEWLELSSKSLFKDKLRSYAFVKTMNEEEYLFQVAKYIKVESKICSFE